MRRTMARREWENSILVMMALAVLIVGAAPLARALGPNPTWDGGANFLAYRGATDKATLEKARKMGLTTALGSNGELVDPSDPRYEQALADVKEGSRYCRDHGMALFLGWHAVSRPNLNAFGAYAKKNGIEYEAKNLTSVPEYWRFAFEERMLRLADELKGPEYRLDGFIPDIERYDLSGTGIGFRGTDEQRQAARELAAETRRKVREILPNARFGLYPIRPRIGPDKITLGWLQGFADPEHPVFILSEHTYDGYNPHVDLTEWKARYVKDVGAPVAFVPGFNFLRIQEPEAWKTHLYNFARVADGYWLYPAPYLLADNGLPPPLLDRAFKAVRAANEEIALLRKAPDRESDLDFRPQWPHELDRARIDELVELARMAQPVKPSGDAKGAVAAPETIHFNAAELLVRAGPGEPVELEVAIDGGVAVYGPDGEPLLFEQATRDAPKKIRLEVKQSGVYPVAFAGSYSAAVKVFNRFWAFTGRNIWTSQGRKKGMVGYPDATRLYFRVPEGVSRIGLYLSERGEGVVARLRDASGDVMAEFAPEPTPDDIYWWFHDTRVEVPGDSDGQIWSIEGKGRRRNKGLPVFNLCGLPVLLNPDPDRLLVVPDDVYAAKRAALRESRRRRVGGATQLWVEAETMHGGPWRILHDANPPSYKAIFSRGFKSTKPLYDEIDIPSAGDWSVWVRALVQRARDRDRTVTVKVGDKTLAPTHRKQDVVEGYEMNWQKAGVVKLEAGETTIEAIPRVGGRPRIDVIVLTDDPKWNPARAEKSSGD